MGVDRGESAAVDRADQGVRAPNVQPELALVLFLLRVRGVERLDVGAGIQVLPNVQLRSLIHRNIVRK